MKEQSCRTRYVLASLVLINLIMLTACGGATVVEYPAEEQVGEIAVVPEEVAEAVRLSVLVPEYGGTQSLPESLFAAFVEQYPWIDLELMYVPFYDYSTVIKTSLAAGDAPNVVVLGYNDIAAFQVDNYIISLGEMWWVDQAGFLPAAMESNTFSGNIYGVPWMRAGCSPNYQNLALMNSADQAQQQAASTLFEYLISDQVQMENYSQRAWFPTREAVYGQLSLDCGMESQAIYLQADFVSPTATYIAVSVMANLETVLDGMSLNPEYATAYYVGDEVLVRAAPTTGNFPEEYVFEALGGNGLLLGSISAIQDVRGIPAGDYAVWCFGDQNNVSCELRAPDISSMQVNLSDYETTPGPVGISTCVLEEGSKKMCWYLDGLKFCVTVG